MSKDRILYWAIGFTCILASALAGPAWAVKPGQEVNPNGFPSGEHFNLNIHGKKLDFNCPEPDLDENGDFSYGKSLFVPIDGMNIQIIMESGNAKGKKAAELLLTDLQVTDACTADFDGDAARLRLPPNEKGYRVYGRGLAWPTDGSLTVEPELLAAYDENGTDLIYLGLVTDNGFESATETFTRKGKKPRAIDVTGLFLWSGEVCYFTEALCEPIDECTPTSMCCGDTTGDGIVDTCEDPLDDGTCLIGTATDTYCKAFDAEWVFNISDWVEYVWNGTNDGVGLVNVRFYPVK
jgi:hypothetical protein